MSDRFVPRMMDGVLVNPPVAIDARNLRREIDSSMEKSIENRLIKHQSIESKNTSINRSNRLIVRPATIPDSSIFGSMKLFRSYRC